MTPPSATPASSGAADRADATRYNIPPESREEAMRNSPHAFARLVLVAAASAVVATPAAQTASGKAPTHAAAVQRLLISNVMIIPGTGVPAYGPNDILIENGLIARIGSSTC